MVGTTNQTLRPFLWRAGKLYPDREIVSRTAEGLERYTYSEYEGRVAQLAGALADAGIETGDRVATFCWNHNRHFETYFGVPSMGAQLHTINPLLPDHHIQYIVENAQDRLVFVDPSLAPKLAGAVDEDAFDSVEQFVVMASEVPDTDLDPVTDYESFIADYSGEYDWPDLPEEQPAGMCYTSGTTGKPKGVEYSQQMLWAHTMATLPKSGLDIGAKDVVMPVVPMFHVNAWGLPFSTTAAGAKHVYPGPSPTPEDLAKLIEEEGVTMTAGVPTVWLGLLDYLDENDADISSLDRIIIGGSAAPKSVIRRFDEEYDVDVLHAWGMTETSPVGTVAHLKPGMEDLPAEEQYEKRGKQGLLAPGLEMRVVDDDGNEVPWNGEDFGELWIRGPWVTTEYFERPEANEEDFEGNWLKTGDVVTVDEDGYVKIVDRAKDVIKSGGEWISSVELENAIMAHDDVAEATVIGVPHERWQERPVAFIVPKSGTDEDALKQNIVELVKSEFPKWWTPDEVVFIEEVPKTATGKFDKKVLRNQYDDSSLVEGKTPDKEAPSGN
ncbi:fatty-acid--CoA ligase [Haloferax mediterranei ATCC 33500]|uniref:Fatty-acid--CoA ligase n=1 Tax=Haloferax mediterranei (strain ATCC 33500 / DSM 1411 / JCM 8866 / NBRC 14739 / NCIMB 2177 / R-4) TaxID=523841 RepID=I3R4J9_HALMT|nr:long-chain fatty acid--CoA ligase [Haloferax mediterranei]AFK19159.2 medium-chain-fatty-acid-CoA ligase [Haloferax mediterranei ATCC 33500]AHZ21479.1 fatty-acid--CoA ligase [Haloferax mediterranei ATCC 33500]EMA03939.1 medium-chain-fatty-acid-CoA ligase [Haloferax mediterranei ATCC 33500]MDX5989257.1 long-chain fatty acid--CoA ligase [Haloferax mediterranei ATCC 33500]QCQ75628.1 fatty-acid--CoA ligase [Haloferax mediterranei ATCC 33500]